MAVGKRYRAEHIHPGLVGYPEDPEAGTILVTPEALDHMRSSFIGKPVVNFDHTDVSPEELFDFTKEQMDEIAVGAISDAGRDQDTGWDWVDMIIWDEETQKNIDDRGYSVSNAYLPEVTELGGKENNVPYDHELVGGEYLHMAIVYNPRYEKAKVYANSKPEEENMAEKKKGFWIFKNAEEPEEKKEDEMDNAVTVENAYFENEDGEKIPFEEMVNAYRSACAAQNEATSLNMEDEVDVDGEKVPMRAIYDAYVASKSAQNAEAPQDVVAEDVVDESKQGTLTNSKKEEKVNEALKNAAEKSNVTPKSTYRSKSQRIAEGRARYGSRVNQEAK